MVNSMNMSKKSILITGNRGWIGNYLQQYLQNRGYKVLGVDRERDIVTHLNYKVDLVIHLAAEVGRLNGEEHPRAMLETNILGTLNVLDGCRYWGSKLINFSTSEVSFPLTNVYGISKDCAEKLIEHYATNYNLQACTVRPMMLYGAGQVASDYKSALDRFVLGSLHDKEYEVHRGAVRSWLHIKDFVRAIEKIVDNNDFNKYEVYDIGSDDYRTMEEIAEIVGGEYKVINPPKFLTVVKKADYSKIKDLGWQAKIKLEDGLKELLDWHT